MELRSGEAFARELDRTDPLRHLRDEFHLPSGPDGEPLAYFAGNSLGLAPRRAREIVARELDDWDRLAVDAHFRDEAPWFRYHETVRAPLARLVGAAPQEVVAMNGLTVNLHLLLVTFFRPDRGRFRILIEEPVFPSDRYAVETHLRHHGLDPADALVRVAPRPGEDLLRHEDLEEAIHRHRESLAVVFLSGVSFLTGQRLDIPRIVRAAHAAGARAGFDLAHAAGNVPLRLHDWEVDFAAWCSYKYLNGGPGATAGAFVHERHAADASLPRFGGWWGNDPATRFHMHLGPSFRPVPTADGWQLSNPSVLSLAPLRASLDLFDRAGMEALREKSLRLTGYLEFLLRERAPESVGIVTPADPEARGCQLSLRVRSGARALRDALQERGVVCDFREPDTVRAAPVPLYNRYHDVWKLADVLS